MQTIRYEEHTDSVPEKIRLIQAAYAEGNLDVVMSLAASLKETARFEQQLQHPTSVSADLDSDHFVPVDRLPETLAEWAEGWKFCKVCDVFETVGIARFRTPVSAQVAFRDEQTSDLNREVRVARLDPQTGQVREVVSQVDDVQVQGDTRHARLTWLADVAEHDQATYLILYGNPLAERPGYLTDLQVRGEGYGLDIENHHFTARLSRQMGQLERLTYKRQHGLELYAGGKGHGEPPGIDWAHDYVDQGNFQKLRMRNWSHCENYEVTRGPICVRVRRFGFPHSPLHPLFTPSRIHMDQSYAFYAGLPYFFKEGRIDAVKDVEIEAMRDDEWVFSGYSFTETLWFDQQGKLHEGSVPPESRENLWGVGFYHRESRDAFVALWLEHAADNFDQLSHGGTPTLHYDGHGQLWSRYPAEKTRLSKGASIRQKNAYVVLPFPKHQGTAQFERLRHQLTNPLELRPGVPPTLGQADPTGKLARRGETRGTAPLKASIWEQLREVRDEQLYSVDANVVDLGIVYDVRVRNDVVYVTITMPHRGRPEYRFFETAGGGRVEAGIRERLLELAGVDDVVVEVAWEPAWTAARLTAAGRKVLGLKPADPV